MRLFTLALASTTLVLSLSAPALAAYDAWVTGGLGIYGATADTADGAKMAATESCMAAGNTGCGGAFALSSGTPVVIASCSAGMMSGYVVGQTLESVYEKIAGSPFGIDDCDIDDTM